MYVKCVFLPIVTIIYFIYNPNSDCKMPVLIDIAVNKWHFLAIFSKTTRCDIWINVFSSNSNYKAYICSWVLYFNSKAVNVLLERLLYYLTSQQYIRFAFYIVKRKHFTTNWHLPDGFKRCIMSGHRLEFISIAYGALKVVEMLSIRRREWFIMPVFDSLIEEKKFF